ncbi:MAG: hypothetical protein JWQ50_9270 [Caballeronia mineralivorans]|nr:hypothetical protein [Caballeronia mineralivorans]
MGDLRHSNRWAGDPGMGLSRHRRPSVRCEATRRLAKSRSRICAVTQSSLASAPLVRIESARSPAFIPLIASMALMKKLLCCVVAMKALNT